VGVLVDTEYIDIALCVREIRNYYHNPDFEKEFFKILCEEPDYKKIDYYLLLNEMF